MRLLRILLLTIAFPLCGNSFAQTSADTYDYLSDVEVAEEHSREEIIDSIIDFGKQYLGRPYGYHSASTPVLDCSGFICHLLDQLDISFPRSSSSQAVHARKINFSEVKVGDLLFFKGRNIASNNVGHVSIVIELTEGGLKMMHSCRRGVVIDDYPMSYYRERFLYAGRIEELDKYGQRPGLQEKFSDSSQEHVSVVGVGDLMIGTNFPSSSHLPPNDGKDILVPAHELLINADVAFGNLEGCILTGKGTVKRCNDPAKCYAFKSPDHYIDHYVNAGFDVLSLANNHMGDFGNTGRENTVRILKENGIEFAGLIDYPFTVFEKDSLTYGFCAFSPNTGTLKIHDYKQAREIVSHLDSICDIVIVSFHGGAEGSKHNRVTRKTEIFLGENRGNPYEFSRVVIDSGADIVFGHGPHVVRAVDLYKGRFIAYSLGNFATYSRFNLRGINGYAPIVELEITEQGEFVQGQIHSFKQFGEGGPVVDPNNAVAKEIKRLTELDVPEVDLEISVEGIISKK